MLATQGFEQTNLMCVPNCYIMPEVTDITGLDNYNMTDQTRFDANTGDLLNWLDYLLLFVWWHTMATRMTFHY